jgi:hypothetical protein
LIRIDTPLLVAGRGPAPLVAAKVAAGWGLPTLLAGHEPTGVDEAVVLGEDELRALIVHRVIDILRPSLVGTGPALVSRSEFEDVLKHHCVADVNVTVYDQVEVTDLAPEGDGGGVQGILTDGRSRWELHAEHYIDGATLAAALPEAVLSGVSAAEAVLVQLGWTAPEDAEA